MIKVLLPVDGSRASLRAVEYVVELAATCAPMEIRLVNVQAPADSWELKSFLKPSEIEAMQEAKGGDALAPARQLLDAAGVAYTPAVLLGPVAATLTAYAAENGCDKIVMGNQGESFLAEAVIGSVAHEILRLTVLPVTFVK